jgi:membrane protein DedA with SNARE-associated domain
LEEFVQSLAQLDPLWVYVAIFCVAYVENIFPPFPSDLIVVFAGSLVAVGKGHAIVAVLAAAIGGTLGFLSMFAVGAWFGRQIVESGKLKFLPIASIHKVERVFGRYGYTLIVLNRFLAGTRAVVSFFAGLSSLDVTRTVVLSFVSSLVWNSILMYSGYALGCHWQRIGSYLSTYSQIVTAIVVVVILILVIRYVSTSKKRN